MTGVTSIGYQSKVFCVKAESQKIESDIDGGNLLATESINANASKKSCIIVVGSTGNIILLKKGLISINNRIFILLIIRHWEK